MKLRLAIRAVQEGAKTEEIKSLIFKLNETDPVTDPPSSILRWKALSESWEIWGDREMASLCHCRNQIRLHFSQSEALEEGLAPWATLYSLEKNGALHPSLQTAEFKQRLKERLLKMIAESKDPEEVRWYLSQTKMFCDDKDVEKALAERDTSIFGILPIDQGQN